MTDGVMQMPAAAKAPAAVLQELETLRTLLGFTLGLCQSKAEVNHFLRTSKPALALLEQKLPITFAAFKECVIAFRAALPDTLPEGQGTGGFTLALSARTPPQPPALPDAPLDSGEADSDHQGTGDEAAQ